MRESQYPHAIVMHALSAKESGSVSGAVVSSEMSTLSKEQSDAKAAAAEAETKGAEVVASDD